MRLLKKMGKIFKLINLKSLLVFFIIFLPILYLFVFFNANPELTNLKKRGEFFHLTTFDKSINEGNSTIIEGSKTEGTVMTIIKIPDNFINYFFILKFEAISIRRWDYSIGGNLFVYPSRNLRIELLIDNDLICVFNYTDLPSNLYSDDVKFIELKSSDYNKKLSSSKIIDGRNSKNIKIRLITKHKLYPEQDIFSLYFYDDKYKLIISIGDPDIFFNSISFALLCFWIISIIILYKFNWTIQLQ